MRLTKFKNLKFQSYKPGKYEIPKLKDTKKVIKLSANESALGVSAKVKSILKNFSIEKIVLVLFLLTQLFLYRIQSP